ncbi:ATP-binding protein [Calothrix sp. PCC 7507]|uniref:ATP-binding protein n=1 Tax=Calothrix sp. PCC 7507 TaxID=99598 RepID=UPI00029F3C73|nr:ATP-binding protein [Calothrix sp. PCC 7507]AFY34117.1 AAA ATPase central domain protein [Calothrix sp. PCC 7507]
MNNLESWQKNNEEYLTKALAWLRLCLQRQVQRLEAGKTSPHPTPLASKRPFLGRSHLPALPPGSPDVITEEQISKATAEVADAEALQPPPAMVILRQRLGLSPFEQKVLLLCAAIELDTRIAGLCALAQDNPNQSYPTFALALTIFDQPAWDILSPERPLRYWRLIEINQPSTQPLTTSPLRADERIVNYLKGLNYLDDRLTPLLVSLDAGGLEYKLPQSQQTKVEEITQYLRQDQQRSPIIQLLGTDSPSKELVAQQAAINLSLFLYSLSVELLPSQATELETFARLWERESLLLPIALYVDAQEIAETQVPPLHRFLSRSHGLLFLSSRENRSNFSRPTILVDVDKPTPTEQQQLWETMLGDRAAESPAQLASQFNLNPLSIQQIAQTVLTKPFSHQADFHEQLWSTCLATNRPQLDILAQRLDPKATWDNIVLPEEETSLLHQIADQVRQRHKVYQDWGFQNRMNRGLGISALFAGESGTGKTMAAEVIANDLRLNLYKIDLSAVVSKYIGETEKNLRRLFDAAEDGGAILFFDEADALFGKRSEVKDSHDRYANIEINYLLQRIEAFRGLAILATNMRNALDHAFVRRLRFIVTFTFPTPADRQKMWQRAFPPEMPTEILDFSRLARLNLTGGSIHNIALNAAFLAAQQETPVTMSLVLQAARTEFRKLDRPINEIDFRFCEPTGVTA